MIKKHLWDLIENYGVKLMLLVVAVYVFNWFRNYRGKCQESKTKRIKVLGRLGAKKVELTDYEEIIATEILHADDIDIEFKHIGGLDHIIQELRECMVYPLCDPELFSMVPSLLGEPPGVLLYGPPGCGKTMVAKAIAKESNATLVNLHVSTLAYHDGDSNKNLAAAVFSLAQKLQPTIVFIDEIDSFLRDTDQKQTTSMNIKANLMKIWNEMATGEHCRIMMLGATNRPKDIAASILRRMPKRFAIGLPTDTQRKSILELFLRDIKLVDNFDMDILVQHTDGCSGSDLKEICRNASMIPFHEIAKNEKRQESQGLTHLDTKNINGDVRPLTIADFYTLDQVTGKSPLKIKADGTQDLVDMD